MRAFKNVIGFAVAIGLVVVAVVKFPWIREKVSGLVAKKTNKEEIK